MVRDLPFERYVSDKDMLDFTLRQRYPPIFRISDMLSAKRKNSEELMGEKTKDSRWMIEDSKKRKASLGGFVAGKSGGDYDKMFGNNFKSNQAAFLDAYGQMAYDVLPDIHTDEIRPMVRRGWKPPKSMEYLTDLLVDGPFDDGWDKPNQYFPASNIPLKNLPPRLRTMMDGLKERNFGFPPQWILDNAEDEYGRVGTRNAEKEYRKQGGARDQFIRRSAIEAAILLNILDKDRTAQNKEVVENLAESGLVNPEDVAYRHFTPSSEYRRAVGPQVLYGTEEDQPAIMNEAFSENWQLFNRSDDSPFDNAWDLLKAPFYYHATPEENLPSIMREGLRGYGGEVYASLDPEIARRWISFTNMQAPKIATIPFWRDEGDPRMSRGIDHSPFIFSLLGIDQAEGSEKGSWVSNEPIPPQDIFPHLIAEGDKPGVSVYDNPFYNEEFARQIKESQRGDDE